MNPSAILLATLLWLPTIGLSDDEKKEDKKAVDPIAGTWQATSYEQGGLKAETVPDYVLTFKDGKYSQKNRGEEDETGTYKLDTDAKPQRILLTIETGVDKGKKQPGIFKVSRDKLTLCLALPGQSRQPSQFDSEEGDHQQILVEFERAKK